MGSVRITGGSLARRRVKVPSGAEARALRPTSDKVRAALFDILGPVDGARVVDAFAGTGALGLEALSRGAARVDFIERDRRFAQALASTLRELNVDDRARVHTGDAVKRMRGLGPADLILLDPPYARDLDGRLLEAVESILAPGGTVTLERDARTVDAPGWGLSLVDERVYGGTRVSFFEAPVEGAP